MANELIARSRPEAKRLGEAHYFTGKPCKHGHIAPRSTRWGTCRDCGRETARIFANPEKSNRARRSRVAARKSLIPDRFPDDLRPIRPDIGQMPGGRIEALRAGACWYFTGIPCKNGHVDYRYASNGICRTCGSKNTAVYVAKQSSTPAQKAAERRALLSPTQKDAHKRRRRSQWIRLVQHDPVGRWVIHSTDGAKFRARKKGVPYNLTREYVRSLYVTHCPALGIELVYGNSRCAAQNSAQLDRLKPELGYVDGNVRVISKRANLIKSDASVEEVGLIYRWLSSL